MFYSQTLLARKTALGTVWCAAHLQHRLNKKDYEKTKIPVVVDAIMFGEVPLALRTSSYLLLGVVRIYSKQIDYLKHDFDILVMELRKMHSHASAKLTLPENAYQAPFHSITLPETFDLDAMELDIDIYHDRSPDNHIRSQEEITMAEQVPIGRDAYVAISFDEDIMIDSSHPGEAPESGFKSFEDDTINVEGLIGEEDLLNMGPGEGNMQQSVIGAEGLDTIDVPETEVQRAAATDFSPMDVHMRPAVGAEDTSEPSRLIDENINQENLSSIMKEKVTLPESARPPTSATSQEAPDMIDTPISFRARHSPMEPVIRPSPPQVQEPRPRSRKRKQFDKSTVLTNKFMKKCLEDCSDLLRERRDTPSTSLDVWRLNNRLRKDEVFYHSSITDFCHDLGDMFGLDYIVTKCRSTFLEEASEDLGNAINIASTSETILDRVTVQSPAPEVASSPQPTIEPAGTIASVGETFSTPVVAPSPGQEAASPPHFEIPPTVGPASASFSEMEIEHHHDVEVGDIVASPPRLMPSPRHSEGFGSPSAVIAPTGVQSTLGITSTEPSKSVFETPGTIDEGMGGEDVTLPDVPEQTDAADEELSFLEADSSPAGLRGTQRVGSLSVRTRATGRYLMSLSPTKSISDDSTQDLSLNNILEGKRRKLCARMFYEMLVLKSYDLIDVQQDEPYGDITLKLTSKLSKAQI